MLFVCFEFIIRCGNYLTNPSLTVGVMCERHVCLYRHALSGQDSHPILPQSTFCESVQRYRCHGKQAHKKEEKLESGGEEEA